MTALHHVAPPTDIAWTTCRFCGASMRGDATVYDHLAKRCIILHPDPSGDDTLHPCDDCGEVANRVRRDEGGILEAYCEHCYGERVNITAHQEGMIP